jgi:hypothetical protein
MRELIQNSLSEKRPYDSRKRPARLIWEPAPPATTRNACCLRRRDHGRPLMRGASNGSLMFMQMLGERSIAIDRRAGASPRHMRLTPAVYHLCGVGWQAMPIMAPITSLISGIIAQQGFFHFHRFGAGTYLVDIAAVPRPRARRATADLNFDRHRRCQTEYPRRAGCIARPTAASRRRSGPWLRSLNTLADSPFLVAHGFPTGSVGS